uniref:DNA mismatch repair protein S5 domain-containing protein n=1 Tax=Panagrolaimus sp. PS1159 TaxID=55785 RepID=A0AC35GL62_9BILA
MENDVKQIEQIDADDLLFQPRIQPLDPDIVKQIAAGEVIHQPWNVVKELIENSLDAKSDHIIVSLKDGGFEEVMIRDNGCGIHPDDTEKIAHRFHSSKIKSVDDVYKIQTLGFRGEALSSMALIGKVTIVSKRNGIEDGIRLIIQGKERTKQVEHHCDAGTTIVVTDIFKTYSPSDIRRSNYKITKLVTDYAYANPGIKFVLQTPAIAFRTPNLATSNQKEWIAGILGTKKLFSKEITSTNPPFSVTIFGIHLKEGKMTIKTPKTNLTCFVNRRLVTIFSLEGLLRNQFECNGFSCETIIAFFEMDPSMIDVHVSPTKELVTMRNSEIVLDTVAEAFGDMIKMRYHESQVEAGKSPKTVLSSISNESSISNKYYSPSKKIRFDPNQSLMDSFIENNDTADYESETPSLIEKSEENNMEQDGSREEEQFIFRHVEKIYDSLLDEIQNDCDAEWTTKFRKAQSTKLCKIHDLLVLLFQSESDFYFISFRVLLEEFFYQRLLIGFANFCCVKDLNDQKISLRTLLLTALPEATEEFIQAKFQLLVNSKVALDDYFSITFEEAEDGDLILTGVPVLLPCLSTPWSNIALALIALPEAYPNNIETNQEWIKDVAKRLSTAFAAPLFRCINTGKELFALDFWNSQVIPTIKTTYLCGSQFVNSIVAGSNTDLYKSFDRC